MSQKLSPLGIYDTENSTVLKAELKAYAEGLDTLFDTLSVLERELFIPTAESFGLSSRERFTGREKPGLTTEQRREELLYNERNVTGEITDSAFEAFLERIGLVDYTINIMRGRGTFTLTVNDRKSDGEKALIEKQVIAEIPAYLTPTIIFAE